MDGEPETGQRPRTNFGFVAESPHLSQRPSGRNNPLVQRLGPEESALKDPASQASRRLLIAVLTRALRDFCSSDKSAREVIEWVRSGDFETICHWVGYDPERLRKVYTRLSRVPVEVRKEMLSDLSRRFLGGSRGAKKKEGEE